MQIKTTLAALNSPTASTSTKKSPNRKRVRRSAWSSGIIRKPKAKPKPKEDEEDKEEKEDAKEGNEMEQDNADCASEGNEENEEHGHLNPDLYDFTEENLKPGFYKKIDVPDLETLKSSSRQLDEYQKEVLNIFAS